MYGLAYILIPARFESLQSELDRALAPFRRGGDDKFPRDKLAFADATERLAQLHRSRFRYHRDGTLTWLGGDAAPSFDLSLSSLAEHMTACRLDRFEGTFAEIEPDFDVFVRRFTDFKNPDGIAGHYGHWLNPIGFLDWWELGGRFNGVIIGDRRPAGPEQIISSGPSTGRAIMGNLAVALGGRANAEAEIEANVELVESPKAAAERDEARGLPTAVVLPAGCCADQDRWFDRVEWHTIRPGTRAILGVGADASFKVLARAAYDRFSGHAAAGIAYHF